MDADQRAEAHATAHTWTPITDDELAIHESSALDTLFGQMTEIGGGTATMCVYGTEDQPLGSVTVAHVGELALGIVVRIKGDYSVIPCVLEFLP